MLDSTEINFSDLSEVLRQRLHLLQQQYMPRLMSSLNKELIELFVYMLTFIVDLLFLFYVFINKKLFIYFYVDVDIDI